MARLNTLEKSLNKDQLVSKAALFLDVATQLEYRVQIKGEFDPINALSLMIRPRSRKSTGWPPSQIRSTFAFLISDFDIREGLCKTRIATSD